MKAAAIIWIVNGALTGIYSLVMLVQLLTDAGLSAGIGMVVIALITVVGVVFLITGIQTLRGKSANLRANGIGSIVLGALPLLAGLASGNWAAGFGGVLLVMAGILALVSKAEYTAWHAARSASDD